METVHRGAGARASVAPLRLDYDAALPITAHREEIIQALERHPVIVVCGATGSGKSTQLPKFCLEAGRGVAGLIGHTQPRRIAARALSTRLAEELGTTVGGAVGYQVRFTDRTGPACRVKLMTDGILLKELESDRALRRYDTLIIDEAHERSLNIDLLLGVLRQLLARRSDLRLIVTSATIEPERIAAFFGAAPVIEVSGRSYPVEVRYRPLAAEDEDAAELSLPEGVVAAVRELASAGPEADTLVFLPGEKHIREAAEALERAELRHTEVLPLYARLSAGEQARIFQGHTGRRVILATNVAETSLTVPGIRHVIDSGLARISRYSARAKVQRLHVEPVSQASAEQRKGRCGREAPGVCIRLYAEEDFAAREPYTAPEVLRTNLASVILRMASLELGEPQDFPFLDPPEARLISDGVRLLEELQAMDAGRVTALGHQIAALPLDPRLGRMLLAAAQLGCLAEMLIIAAFLETQDPRERPADQQQQAAEKHALFADARSDFLTVLNLWRAYAEQSGQRTGSQLRKWCREHFLSFLRMREWQELHHQLARSARELGLRTNLIAAAYVELHQGILTGFLGSIGTLNERREYDGPRGIRFVIARGTPLAARPPKWIVAASLLETTRLYARMVAAVEPAWIEHSATHLLKRSYSEPHWVERRGIVGAFETVTLYGLQLANRRRVDYGRIAPREARDIFIREALLDPEDGPPRTLANAPFLAVNRAVRAELERLEAKIRRRDIVAAEEQQVEFYRERIPPEVNSTASFTRWWRHMQPREPQRLTMSRAGLMLRTPEEIDARRFPDALRVGGNRLALLYRFEPGEADDGLTLLVPDVLLERLDADRLAWLVPGWRLEKVVTVLRELPKGQRKQLVPVPEHARQALEELAVTETEDVDAWPGFYGALAPWIARRTATALTAAELAQLPLPPHLRLNIRVVDANDAVLAEGRDLPGLKRALRARGSLPAFGATDAQSAHRQWDFGEVPETRAIERNGLQLVVYPTLRDLGQAVAPAEARDATGAHALLRGAVTRLALLALGQQARFWGKRLIEERELILASAALGLPGSLADLVVQRIFADCFAPQDASLPRTREAFEQMLQRRRSQLETTGERIIATLRTVCIEARQVRAALSGLRTSAREAATDLDAQLAQLLAPQFITATPDPWFGYLPRYLKAAARRVARLPADTRRDAQLTARIAPFVAAWQALRVAQPEDAQRPQLERLRWMIEELRVSLFAQELRTAVPVSERRLTEQLEQARAEARAQLG